MSVLLKDSGSSVKGQGYPGRRSVGPSRQHRALKETGPWPRSQSNHPLFKDLAVETPVIRHLWAGHQTHSVLPSFLGRTVIADSKPFSQWGCDRKGIQCRRPLPCHKCGSALVAQYREKPLEKKTHFPGFTLLITSLSNVTATGKSQRFYAVCFSTLCRKYDFFKPTF